MNINKIDQTNFEARIKISKTAKSYYRDASIMSGLGISATGSGVMSSLPAFDPAHHIHTAAKVVDGMFALIGTGFTTIGGGCAKLAHTLLKEGNKFSKLNK